jgi:hypothetical protein
METFQLFRCITLCFGLLAPVGTLAQTPAPPIAEIESFSGILFYCKPLASEAWTQRMCEEMDREMTSWAASAKKPIALLKTTDTRETNNERAKAAGFDAKHGLWVLLTIAQSASSASIWDVSARADGIKSGQPAQTAQQTTTYTKNDILGRGASDSEAAARGKRTLGVIMNALITPMRPL